MLIQNIEQPTNLRFIALMAILMSFVALSIDAMLPALNMIGKDLQVRNPNDVQFVVSSIFLGMGIGLIFFGPFSDSFGRKPAIYLGMAVFFIGCLASIFSQTFEIMIVGRLLQGVGAASCRVITLAMIRDCFVGSSMARVMSLIMMIFVFVPALAPSVGQGILWIAGWRAIFVFMLILGAISIFWFAWKQPETLPKDKRRPFSIVTVLNGVRETVKNKVSLGYMLASGFVFGSFIGYLSSTQQMFQVQYKLGENFSLVFGVLVVSVGLASFANSKWVMRFGMANLCRKSLRFLVLWAILFLPICIYFHGHPPLVLLIIYLMATFFCFGILFGNMNSLAVQPLGHIAGVANSVIASMQTLLSVVLGGYIGYRYDETVIPLVTGFLVLGFCSLVIVHRLAKYDEAV